MLILSIRTDKPEAEIGLFRGDEKLAYESWEAHRKLAETIHAKIKNLLKVNNLELPDIDGIVIFKGPGSFTGLRIGISVANALADSLGVPIVGGSGDEWVKSALERIGRGEDERLIQPEYGAPPHITKPKR